MIESCVAAFTGILLGDTVVHCLVCMIDTKGYIWRDSTLHAWGVGVVARVATLQVVSREMCHHAECISTQYNRIVHLRCSGRLVQQQLNSRVVDLTNNWQLAAFGANFNDTLGFAQFEDLVEVVCKKNLGSKAVDEQKDNGINDIELVVT
jgi:hypothetical protein